MYGLRRQSEPALIRAGSWPRGRLAIALSVVVALHLMTFWNLDLAARQQLASLRIEAGALALWVAPPRVPDRDNAMVLYQKAFETMGGNGSRPRVAVGQNGKTPGMRNGPLGKARESSTSICTTRNSANS